MGEWNRGDGSVPDRRSAGLGLADHDGLDPFPRRGGDLLWVVERPGHGRGVHTGTGGDVLDRHPLGAPHGVGRYAGR